MSKEAECEPCTYSPGTAADCLQTSSLDIRQLSLLSGMDTHVKFSENERQTDGSQVCECGKGTCGCSIHPSTPEAWIAFMRDSLAKTLALLESKQAYLKEPDQVFTEKSCASLAWYDQSSSSWKTYQQSFLTDSESFSETWPRWGMTVDGYAYAHPMSEHRITETDGLRFVPTPTVTSGAQVAWDKTPGQTGGTTLSGWVRFWPTPLVRDSRTVRGGARIVNALGTEPLITQVALAENKQDGALNPEWVEWLMGFPIGFTDSRDWVTPKSRSKLQQHGNCLEVIE